MKGRDLTLVFPRALIWLVRERAFEGLDKDQADAVCERVEIGVVHTILQERFDNVSQRVAE